MLSKYSGMVCDVCILGILECSEIQEFSFKKKAEPTKHKSGGHIERIQKDF